MGRVRGRASLLILTLALTLVLTAIVASTPPVKASGGSVKLRVREQPYILGVPVNDWVWVSVDIESPIEWDNTTNGIVKWAFDVHVNPDVLTPWGAYGATFDYFLYDFVDRNAHVGHEPQILLIEVNKTTGVMRDISEFIKDYETLGVGAGGNSSTPGWYGEPYGLCRLRFRSKSETAYSLINITDVAYWTPDGVKHTIPDEDITVGHYNRPPPHAEFTYTPSKPPVDETVTFNASASYAPDGYIVSYYWDFGDSTSINETDPIATHTYKTAGTYTVNLTVTDNGTLKDSKQKLITVYAELDVEVVVGSIYFRGEMAEFYVLTSLMGEPVDAEINATLYYSRGTAYEDLSGSVESIAEGLYWVPYTIPPDAPVGTYVMVVRASFFARRGISINSFLLSPTLTAQNALITNIEGDVATILTDVGVIKVDLTAIDATLVGMEGTIAIISSTIGEFTAPADTICATITEIKGDVVTIKSKVGSIEEDIEDINGEITEIDGTLVTIQTSIGLIETNVTAINARLTAINETVGIVKTDLMGLIEVELDKINATIADVQDGLVTINSTLGEVRVGIRDVSLELDSVEGDIKEGVAKITGAVTDAEGNILAELGQVEVRLKDINATLISIDGSLVTIRTDIGTIKGTITSIQGDIATIETDIGLVKAILEEWTGITTSSITTPTGTSDIMVLTNSTLEGSVTFSGNILTIVVSGQTGTTGTVNVKIPRQLLIGIGSNIEKMAVAINGRQVSFTYAEESEVYAVRIVYTHSTQTIKIYLAGSQSSPLPLWILLSVALAMAVTTIVTALRILRVRKKPIKP